MAKIVIIACVLFMFAAASGVASPETFYREMVPAGVIFGVTPDQLTQVRPAARKNNLIQPQDIDGEPVAMVEILRARQRGRGVVY